MSRPELVQPPADLDIRLVEPDHEALVQVAVGLVVDRLDDRLRAVAEVLAGDPSGEVEVFPAVGVPDRRALGPSDHHIGRRDAARHITLPARPDALRVYALVYRHRCQLRAPFMMGHHLPALCLILKELLLRFESGMPIAPVWSRLPPRLRDHCSISPTRSAPEPGTSPSPSSTRGFARTRFRRSAGSAASASSGTCRPSSLSSRRT